MQPPERPKRRMVVYVTEETYALLQDIAKKESRSVSNVAEGKIISGLSAGPGRTGLDRSGQEQTGQDCAGRNLEEFKSSVLDVFDNIPAERLNLLAEKLAKILDRPLPVQTGQDQTVPIPTGDIQDSSRNSGYDIIAYEEERTRAVKDIAVRLLKFIQTHNLSQRGFRKLYGFDITNLRFWITGEKMMEIQTLQKIEKILLTVPDNL